MKTFYQYLTEVQWQGSLSEKLFKPAGNLAGGVWIPLSNAVSYTHLTLPTTPYV